jgi:hypothetical protein
MREARGRLKGKGRNLMLRVLRLRLSLGRVRRWGGVSWVMTGGGGSCLDIYDEVMRRAGERLEIGFAGVGKSFASDFLHRRKQHALNRKSA